MKTNNSTTTTTTNNKTDKSNRDIRNNSLFTDITAQEEVFVRGGVVDKKDLTKKK